MVFVMVVNFIKTALFTILLGNVLGRKKTRIVLCGVFGVWGIQTALNYLNIDGSVALMVMFGVHICFEILCFQGGTSKKVFWSSLYMVIVIVSQYVSLLMVSLCYGDVMFAVENGHERYVTAGGYLGMIAVSVCCLSLSRKKTKATYLPVRYQLFLVGIVMAGIGITDTLSDLLLAASAGENKEMEGMINLSCIVVLCMLLALVFLIQKIGEVFEKKRIVDMQKKQYEMMEASLTELRMWRHDYKNNLMLLSYMVKDKRYEELEQFLEQAKKRDRPQKNGDKFWEYSGRLPDYKQIYAGAKVSYSSEI